MTQFSHAKDAKFANRHNAFAMVQRITRLLTLSLFGSVLVACIPMVERVYQAKAAGGERYDDLGVSGVGPRLGVTLKCEGVAVSFSGVRSALIEFEVPAGHQVRLFPRPVKVEFQGVISEHEYQPLYIRSAELTHVPKTEDGGFLLIGTTEKVGSFYQDEEFYGHIDPPQGAESFRVHFPDFEVDDRPCSLPPVDFKVKHRPGLFFVN